MRHHGGPDGEKEDERHVVGGVRLFSFLPSVRQPLNSAIIAVEISA